MQMRQCSISILSSNFHWLYNIKYSENMHSLLDWLQIWVKSLINIQQYGLFMALIVRYKYVSHVENNQENPKANETKQQQLKKLWLRKHNTTFYFASTSHYVVYKCKCYVCGLYRGSITAWLIRGPGHWRQRSVPVDEIKGCKFRRGLYWDPIILQEGSVGSCYHRPIHSKCTCSSIKCRWLVQP